MISKLTLLHYQNAKTAIAQIKNGEWVPIFNSIGNPHITAKRSGMELWLGNGSFFCEINDGGSAPYFWPIFRHWVWWSAARRLARDADKAKLSNKTHKLT